MDSLQLPEATRLGPFKGKSLFDLMFLPVSAAFR